ncbi:MAG: endonuclease MutS2 [Capsulimonadaceae bacterium]|nr:endonuclease MutS2 [Capsulimonadaceae bacterium]
MDEHALRTLEYDAIRRRLADDAACSLGVERALGMTPETNLAAVQALLDETAEARAMFSIKGGIPLGGITDIRPELRQSQIGGVLDPEQLLAVASTAGAARSLKAFLAKAEAGTWPLLVSYGNRIGVYSSLESAIGAAIAPNGLVLDSASMDLARIRSRKRVAEGRLREKLNSIITGPLRNYLQDPVIVQRADRACVPVKAEHRGAFGGIVHDTSSSGATLFVEPAAVVELGNEVREMEVQERQEIQRILMRLTGMIQQVSPGLWATVDALSTIDFIAARARLADRMNAVEPEIGAVGVTRLLSARHPLIDPEKVVAIDISLGEAENRALLITGPNTGGKTVTLKTVGLLTLMAQSGLHVPAARATIHLFDQVFSDIGDEQSIQQSLSTFSSHMTNIARILAELGPNALVLLDEVGAGTDPGEGAALARALLSYLLSRNARVVATSHYGELKSFAYTTDGIENASVEFDDVSLRPTYRLLQGIPGSSNAIAIAGRLGLPEEVLADARSLTVTVDEASTVIKGLEEAKRAALGEAKAAQEARREARVLREKAERELSQYEELRHEVRRKALEEARTIIRKAQDRAANLVADVKRRASAHYGSTVEADRAATQIREDLRDVEREAVDEIDALLALPRSGDDDETEAAEARPLHAGDRVRVPSLGLAGTLVDEPSENDKVSVQVGRLRVSVAPSSLVLLGGPPPLPKTPPKSQSQVIRTEREQPLEAGRGEDGIMAAAAVSQQLSLIGMRAEEALMSLDRYLDIAYGAGVERVRIVHGKGSGVLRRVVQDHLKTHAYVESFVTADPDEGGAGATIALMKK